MRSVIAFVLLLAAACDTPTIPGRDPSDIFAFDLPTQPPVVFRWPVGSTIRIFVAGTDADADTHMMRDALDAGAAAWNALAVFAEYRLESTTDIARADVVMAFNDVLLPVDTDACRPLPILAVTTFCVEYSGALPAALRVFPSADGSFASRTKMIVQVLATQSTNPDAVRRIVAHELGHVLGLSRHSGDARDLMAQTNPQIARPGPRDAATVLVLYHAKAGLVP